jgi:hypothetical protein
MAKKNKGGRPTKMDELTVKKLEEAFTNGATDVQACFYAGITKQTLYNYQNKNPEFIDRKEGLKAQLGLIAKNVLAKSIRTDNNSNDAKWYLERKEKAEFSTREEVTGANGEPLTVTVTRKTHKAK